MSEPHRSIRLSASVTLMLGLIVTQFPLVSLAQATRDPQRPSRTVKDRFAKRLAEICHEIGIGLPREGTPGQEGDLAYVLLWHENGAAAGLEFNRSGRSKAVTFTSRFEGDLLRQSKKGGASRGLEGEERRQVWDFLVSPVRLLEAVWSADSSLVLGRHVAGDGLDRRNENHVWNVDDGRPIGIFSGSGSISALDENRRGLALCDGEQRLVAGAPDGRILIRDLLSVLD